jgi:acyl-CoA thioesterase-2
MTDVVVDQESTPETVGALLELLDLERLDRDLFRAHNLSYPRRRRLFGGQVAAQALRAATMTVDDDRTPHSLHGYFLRPGRSDLPTILHVARDRDGRSVSARRVTAIQEGQVIFTLSSSFQARAEGPELNPSPDSQIPLPDEAGAPLKVEAHLGLFDIRPVTEAHQHGLPDIYWARSADPLPDDPLIHVCVLTYLSDMGVGEGELSARVAGMDKPSVDHAVWFHRPARLDEWTLFAMRPLSAQAGRGLYTGAFYTTSGTLIGTMIQECLFRAHLT